jgi:iron complex transport system substrate-binding protein
MRKSSLLTICHPLISDKCLPLFITCVVPLLLTAVATFAGKKDSLLTVTITDMANRKVTIPKTINNVYATSPMGEVLMYTLAPSKIAGKTWNLDDAENRLLIDEYLKKPVLGGWFGKNTIGNPEFIMKAHPDIVVSMGYFNKTDLSSAESIEEKLGIPVIMLDAHLNMLDSTYRFIGKILGINERSDTLAAYCRSTIDLAVSTVSKIPDTEKVRVFYAEGINGLETDPEGSMHTEVLKMVGGINVAQVPLPGTYGRGTVSFEQILVWKPEIILVCLDHGYPHGTEHFTNILSNQSWKTIDAVTKGYVYCIPSLPFNWFDRPPSVNRLIGIRWLGNLLYPQYFKLDIKEETIEFYKLFYHKKLIDSELAGVLANAIRK